jgi:hypothetical protein
MIEIVLGEITEVTSPWPPILLFHHQLALATVLDDDHEGGKKLDWSRSHHEVLDQFPAVLHGTEAVSFVPRALGISTAVVCAHNGPALARSLGIIFG